MRMPQFPRHRLPALLVLLLALLGRSALFSQDTWGTWYSGSSTLAAAKQMALSSNRPLLVVAGVTNCAHCESLETKVLHTTAFKNFARDNKIVLFECRDLSKLTDRIGNNYRADCGMTKTYPFTFIFKVNQDADLTKSEWTSLDPSEVTLLTIASGPYAGRKSGFNYAGSTAINGVTLENEVNWKPSTFIEVLKTYFPNQFWTTTTPSDDDPPVGDDDPPVGDDDDPPVGDDPGLEIPIDDSLWGGIWLQTNQLAQAKAYALANNRPLLVVAGVTNCAHCESLENKVLHTTAFRNYAKEKKIVLFECRDLPKLTDRLGNNYRADCGMTKTYPFSFLFMVNPGADLTKSEWTSLDPSEVTLLEISSGPYAGRKSGFNYAGVSSINGVNLESEVNWKPSTYIEVLETYFPNQQWSTIDPPAAPSLTGYENAADLGRIPNLDYLPATNANWIVYSTNQFLTATAKEKWYKFTGDLGKRYVFSAKDIINANSGVNLTMALYASSLVDNVSTPVTPALKTVTSAGFDAFDRGIQIDMPTGTAVNQTFLLRIKHDGGATLTDMVYTLKVHEAHRAPAAGAVTNPHWTGALPGQWTMDRAAAEAAAKADGKPVIYLFSGLLWCPYCVAFDTKVLQSPGFANATANAYLVVLDNRHRDDKGPSLLRDNSTGGYLPTHGLDDATAAAKLADNIALQTALALPGATNWGPAGDSERKRITYPTLVYCIPETSPTRAAVNGLVAVGRIANDYESASVIAKLEDLADMAESGFVEDNNYANDSAKTIASPESQHSSRIGGSLILADWWQFTVSPDMVAALAIQGDNPPTGATITMTVYAEDGLTALKTATGPAETALDLDFAPPLSTGGTFRLRVTASGASSSFAYTLTYSEISLSYKLAMAAPEVFVSRHQQNAPVAVRITEQKANNQDIRFRYRVVPAVENALLEVLFTQVDWTEVVIPDAEKGAGETVLTAFQNIPVDMGAWSGSRDYVIEIEAAENGNCQVDIDTSRTLVKVMATTIFAPRPAITSFNLIKGVPVSGLIFPVCVGSKTNILQQPSAGTLPDGLLVKDKTDDPDWPRIEITGTPTTLDAVGKTARLSLITDIDNIDVLDLQFTVSELPESGATAAFAGHLASTLDNTSAARAIRGDITVTNDLSGESGLISVRVTTQDTIEPSVFETTAWSSYSPSTGNLELDLVANDGSSLQLSVALDGSGSGTYTSPLTIPYSVHLAPLSGLPGEYAGYYTVALRELNVDDTYSFHGWLQVDVSANGAVTYQGELIDGTAIGPITSHVTPNASIAVGPGKQPYGELTFFQPLYWAEELGKYAGRLAGRLAIFPKTDREGENINDAWISACYGDEVDNPVWEKSAENCIYLDPCGTVFDQNRSVAAQVDPEGQSPYFYFNMLTPSASMNTIIPDHIMLEEVATTPAMTVAADGILAGELSDLEYDKIKGTFTGTVNVLNTVNGGATGALERTSCPIRGILTPITSDCCRETANLAVGYGYFNYDGSIYIATLNAQATLATEAPTLVALEGQTGPDFNPVFQKGAVSLMIDAPSRRVLRRETALDGTSTALFLHDWTAEETTAKEFTLSTLRQEFVGLEENKAESDILAIPLTPALAVAAFAVPDANGEVPEGAIAVTSGWNLLGVPWNVRMAADYELERGRMTYDEAGGQALVPATSLSTGDAVWVFLEDGQQFVLYGETTAPPAQPPAANAWHFIADPGNEAPGTRWFWVNGQFTTEPPAQPEWQGVWFLPTQE